MKCPYCEHLESKVIDSRPVEDGALIRRRRECLKCEGRFTTYEKIETMQITVVKRDKSRQPFDRGKILHGLMRACVKRPVPRNIIETVASDIEAQLANSLEGEVTTEKIGQLILHRLKDIDEVAYVRFASVYRDFADVDTFMRELMLLKNEKND